MTPKEKAEELVDKLYQTTPNETCFSPELEPLSVPYKAWEQAKQCALIAVDEILKLDVFDCNDEWSDEDGDTREYWKQVKQEIEKL